MALEYYEDKLALLAADLSNEINKGLCDISEAHVSIALAQMAQARSHLELADLHQARAIAEMRKG